MRAVLNASLLFVAVTVSATSANAWYCTAKSKNGAIGTGFNFFQVEAEKTAIKECRALSKGHRCAITSCW